MNEQLFTNPFWHAIAWTMLHFLWIGGLLTALIGLVRQGMTWAPPWVRYWGMIVALCSMVICCVAVSQFVWRGIPTGQIVTAPPVQLHPGTQIKPPLATHVVPQPMTANPAEQARLQVSTGVASSRAGVRHQANLPPARQRWQSALLGWLPLIWLCGTPITAIWLAVGLLGAARIRSRASLVTDSRLLDQLERLRGKLNVTRRVRLAICDRIAAPILVGVLRPMILLPSAALTGWAPEHLEMALIHELAHVRRGDNLVNLIQRVVEALFFFHPGVWLVSRWVRQAREEACDAVVVSQTADPQQYASLLMALSTGMTPLAVPTGSGMANRAVATRVRRILRADRERLQVSRGMATAVLSLLVFAVATARISSQTVEDRAANEGQRSKPAAIEESRPVPDVNELSRASNRFDEIDMFGDYAPAENNVVKDPSGHFLSFEQQRLADQIYKATRLDLEPLKADEIDAVKKADFSGGLRIVGGTGVDAAVFGPLRSGGILVGLHVWPTTDLESVARILARDDLAELQPLKVFVLQPVPGGGRKLVTSRYTIDVPSPVARAIPSLYPTAPTSEGPPREEGVFLDPQPFPEVDRSGQRNPHVPTTYPEAPSPVNPLPSAPFTPIPYANPAQAAQPQTWPARQTGDDTIVDPRTDASPVAPSTPLFEGATFEQWQNRWRQELSNENRKECVVALAAFGATSRGREAAGVILEIVQHYEWDWIGNDSVQAYCIGAFVGGNSDPIGYRIPSDRWLPVLRKQLASAGASMGIFALRLASHTQGETAKAVQEMLYDRLEEDPTWLPHDSVENLLLGSIEVPSPRLLKMRKSFFEQEGQEAVEDFLAHHAGQGQLPLHYLDDETWNKWLFESSPVIRKMTRELLETGAQELVMPAGTWPKMESWLADVLADPNRAVDEKQVVCEILQSAQRNEKQPKQLQPETLARMREVAER